jgi:hypothetical protein
MQQLTMKEVREQYGGALPPGAVLRAEEPTPPSPLLAKPTLSRKPKQRARSERFAVLNAFVDYGIATAKLTAAEIAVWLVLFRDTKPSGTARTGQADIARRTGLDVRTVRRAVATLTTKGMIQVVRRGRLNGGPSTYCVQSIPVP